MEQLVELTLLGRNYEQELRPLIRAFLPGAQFEVSHDEVSEESMRIIFSQEDTPALLKPNAAYDYSFCLLLMEDWYRLRVYKKGQEIGRADADGADGERKAFRNRIARELYDILHKDTGRVLPWGILTGVRPTKQVYEALERGQTEETIAAHMRSEYDCSEEKIEVSLTVAKREYGILKQMDYRNGYSIYIGIPFCPTTCHYCSFTSYPIAKFGKLADDYLDALEKEIIWLGGNRCGKKQLQTVYVGGGTPTALNEEQLERLLLMIKTHLPMEHCVEYTVEAGRPDSITREKLKLLKQYGVTRISINPQTMQQHTLDLIGRRHTVEQIREAFALAREEGHQNINMDIIIGLTGETPEDVAGTLAEIGKLQPDSLTVHTLAVKRAARLNTERERYEGMEATNVPEMLEKTIAFAKQEAYLPYYLYRQKNMAENLENVGYARFGKEGIYNILIMEEKQTILAAGAGASTKFVFQGMDRIERVENVKSLTDYISRIDEMLARKEDFLADADHAGVFE